jgi:YD repeat-containing protein
MLTDLDDSTELYSLNGALSEIRDRHGNRQVLFYDSAGFLTKVEDAFGRSIQFSYGLDFQGNAILTGATDPGGASIQYVRHIGSNGTTDPSHDSVVYQDSKTRRYVYDESLGNPAPNTFRWALTGILDENASRKATFKYDSLGRAIESDVGGGIERHTLQYQSGGARQVVDPLGTQRAYQFGLVAGRIRQSQLSEPCVTGCTTSSTAATYDANGNVASRTDFNGNRTNYTHDLARNLEISRTEGLTSAGATTPQTRTITTEWHPTFRLVKRIAEPLRITTNGYNGDGGASCGLQSDGVTLVPGVLCSKAVQATTDASGASGFGATLAGAPRIWTYTYNANGQVLTVNGPRTDVVDVTSYTYHPANDSIIGRRGKLATIANALNHTTQITAYNAHGQPLTIVDPNGLTTSLAYDQRQRLTSRTLGGEATAYTYDSAGQLTKVTLPDNSFLSYTYDAAHRLAGIQDNLGNRIAYTLDSSGNRTKEEIFDPANSLKQTRSRVFSGLNRLFRELGALGQTTEYGYDNQGNIVSIKDPLNKTTGNEYDPLNRLKKTTDPNSGSTLYGYNGQDALTSVTDPRNLTTAYVVSGLGDLLQQASPDSGITNSTHNSAGSLLTQTDAKGQVTVYMYDALERVTQVTFSDGSRQVYGYDSGTNGVGRLVSITETNPANQVTNALAYTYTAHGRLSSEVRTLGRTSYAITYSYDSTGRLTGLGYPSGRTVAYSFDALGRVNQISTSKDGQTQVLVQNAQYHPFGGAKSWTFGNGQIYSRTIDQDGRIAAYTLGAASNAITYDAASRITGIAGNSYGYDALDRLTSAILPSSNYGYSYDPVGNRLTKTTGANPDVYTYSSTSNRISALTPFGSPSRSFVFDPNGSNTSDGQNTYAYDVRGRLVLATGALGATNYQVNALGQRVRKTNSQGDTVFTYDTWGKLIAETDPSGGVKREYVYLGDIPVAVMQGGAP